MSDRAACTFAVLCVCVFCAGPSKEFLGLITKVQHPESRDSLIHLCTHRTQLLPDI